MRLLERIRRWWKLRRKPTRTQYGGKGSINIQAGESITISRDGTCRDENGRIISTGPTIIEHNKGTITILK